jgi:hypothetical protein
MHKIWLDTDPEPTSWTAVDTAPQGQSMTHRPGFRGDLDGWSQAAEIAEVGGREVDLVNRRQCPRGRCVSLDLHSPAAPD